MEGSGRKSVAALSVVALVPGKPPEPPESLESAAAEVWRRVVATKPHDWFSADTFPLLAEYCRATVFAGEIAAELTRFPTIPTGKKLKRYDTLRRMQKQNGNLLAQLATKMRLAQQSRYGARGAETAARRGEGVRKPWASGE
jgi:hypothetical protein